MIYPLPVFAEFEIETDNFFCPASSTAYKKVIFHLVNGVDSIECEMMAKRIVVSFDVPVDNDPQNNLERDFEYLEVDCETEVIVELDYVQKIKLTEKQMLKLNEYLKDEMKMVEVA